MQPSAKELLVLLKEANKPLDYIIDVFVCIIQTKQMYGGSIEDILNYQIHKIKQELHK